MGKNREIFVYAAWDGPEPSPLGVLYADGAKAAESYCFEYDAGRLGREGIGPVLDPDLEPYGGRQFAPADRGLFGMFSDCCPDRWGRRLLKRREQLLAKTEARHARTLTEADLLLGVYDETRMGALRFKLDPDGGAIF